MKNNATAESLRKARDTVFRLLKIRYRSEKEIREKLKRKNFSAPIIEQTIQYFKDLELINDRQFAQKWISSRLGKPFGLNRIRFELKDKGIDADILQQELKEATRNYPETEIATALAKRQAAKYENIAKIKVKQRLYGYLARRGFSSTAINKALGSL